jgi:hypothetical protein
MELHALDHFGMDSTPAKGQTLMFNVLNGQQIIFLSPM